MPYVLPVLALLGQLSAFIFLTLSIASGLYYLSELVEEHSVLSAKVLRRLIYAVILVQALLWLVDGFPFYLTLLGIASHGVYMTNLRHFPIVKLTDPWFLMSCGLVIANHWLWFRHFSDAPTYSRSNDRILRDRYTYTPQPSFTEIASYFGLCVWLVPFALFVSLSAGENVLPSMGSEYATGEREGVGGGPAFKKGHRRRNTGMAKAAVNSTREWISENGAVLGLWRHENVRTF
ncbi:Protein SVP26 [Cyphellophora attinorum]|uniref:Protein SVP26 n=1 Tax=Cyphellophora attinorum TaxID=1664694 RepID=A0A0N0NRZ6_9EURO|nr:Protein SVP26 [Phialophora attinorum]KPI45668.1 Protein SVP26 [Phialophora attinorum]